MKKTVVAFMLILGLPFIACNKDTTTPDPSKMETLKKVNKNNIRTARANSLVRKTPATCPTKPKVLKCDFYARNNRATCRIEAVHYTRRDEKETYRYDCRCRAD